MEWVKNIEYLLKTINFIIFIGNIIIIKKLTYIKLEILHKYKKNSLIFNKVDKLKLKH